MRGSLIVAVVAATALLAVGCAKEDYYKQSQTFKDDQKKEDAKATEKRLADMAGYVEFEHEGRTYVVGSDKTAAKVKAGQEMPYQVTKIIGGKTIKFEASKESDSMDKKLIAEYRARHGADRAGQASSRQ